MISSVGQDNFKALSALFNRLLTFITMLIFSQFALSGEMTEETTIQTHGEAVKVVELLHTNLLEVMKAADTMSFTERYAKLEPTVSKIFDTPLIAKVILSRYWDDLTEEQQTNFIALFNRQSIATYASRFNKFDNEIFEIKTTEQLKKGRLLVRSEILSNNGNSTNLDYLMQQNNGNWYIISVIADGVNDLSLKRAEYSTIIKENGYENLVKDIEKKVEEMENRKYM